MACCTKKLIVVTLLVLLSAIHLKALCQDIVKPDLNALSEQLLTNIREGKDTRHFQEALKKTSLAALEQGLADDYRRIAFWVNIYNAYIQLILSENPGLYKDRDDFFKREQIPIAGKNISFAKIEHGILRKSQWEFGLGYFRKWFPDEFERRLRVQNPDYRIHFALNCGAKSCPPVAIYTARRLDTQLKTATRNYLQRTSTYDKKQGEVAVTALFNWFRGDFGGSSGIRKILADSGVIPRGSEAAITYKDYDWTLHLDNFTTL